MNGTFGSGDGTVNMKKDLDPVGSNYTPLSGVICCYVMWAAEAAGRFSLKRAKINLDAFGAAANDAHEFVAVAHPKFQIAADGGMQYGEDVKAAAGQHAQEGVVFDLDELRARGDIRDLLFGMTCVGNPLAMSNLGELQLKITQVEYARDASGAILLDKKSKKRIIQKETPLVPPQLRSIENAADAALGYRIHFAPNGALLRRVTDITEFPERSLDGNQAWRDLLGQLRGAVQRPMFEPAA